MPKEIDFDNLESNVIGTFRETLEKFGYNPDDVKELQTIRHNAFKSVLIVCYEKLFKSDSRSFGLYSTLLPFEYNNNNIYILQSLADIYIKLCSLCGKSIGVSGFSAFTGYSYETLTRWKEDVLNPKRSQIIQKIFRENQRILTDRLQDTPLGSVAVANNDEETGLKWSANNQQNITKNTVFVLPGERVKDSLQGPAMPRISKE